MSGEAGFQALDAMIAKLSRLVNAPEETAKLAAPEVVQAVRTTAGAGTSPDGVTWKLKLDGKPALVNAAASVQGVADGTRVRLRLVGTSTGSAQAQAIQNQKRPILPSVGRLGKPVTAALTEAARRYFLRSMGK